MKSPISDGQQTLNKIKIKGTQEKSLKVDLMGKIDSGIFQKFFQKSESGGKVVLKIFQNFLENPNFIVYLNIDFCFSF